MNIKKLAFNSLVLLAIIFLFSNRTANERLISMLKDSGILSEVVLGKIPNDNCVSSTEFDYLPTSTTNQLVQHRYFMLSYDEGAEQAEWVAYELKKEYVKTNVLKRPYFIADPKVITGSADWRNYKKSGYDKGHLCPAADMKFDMNAFRETFFTSNISPQLPEFNGGIWNRLEQKVRYWALRYDGVYVVTGGVLKNPAKTIGEERVVVPEYFYKIVLDNSNGTYKMIAFLVPNRKSDKPLFNYVVSVDSLEKMTGIDFFSKLDNQMENDLEKRSDYRTWVLK